ncbi:MAG: hypothetical protein LRY27_00850 [Chitinophagales bacterium]|nr:hypothetical protein [Chitinophagales bacterium]
MKYIFIFLFFLIFSCKKPCEVNKIYLLSGDQGCGNFMVYNQVTINNNPNSFLTIVFDREKLSLNEKLTTFSYPFNENIRINIDEFNEEGAPYCTDIISINQEKTNSWYITDGNVKTKIIRDRSECDETYLVYVLLENATFMDSTNQSYFVQKMEFNNVYVNYSIP